MSSKNIEIKARCVDLEAMRVRVSRLPEVDGVGVDAVGIEKQVDTYFRTAESSVEADSGDRDAGRLKLRETSRGVAELIPYLRANRRQARASLYERIPIPNPESTKLLLEQLLGVRCVVVKEREIFLWRGVRIHLDRVEGLGEFVELEGVCTPELDEVGARARVEELLERLQIDPSSFARVSYENLLLEQQDAP